MFNFFSSCLPASPPLLNLTQLDEIDVSRQTAKISHREETGSRKKQAVTLFHLPNSLVNELSYETSIQANDCLPWRLAAKYIDLASILKFKQTSRAHYLIGNFMLVEKINREKRAFFETFESKTELRRINTRFINTRDKIYLSLGRVALKQLERLRVEDKTTDENLLTFVRLSPGIQNLNLSKKLFVGSTNLLSDNACLMAINSLPHLRTLTLQDINLNQKWLEISGKLRNIISLTLIRCDFNSETWQRLVPNLTSLQKLDVFMPYRFTDESICQAAPYLTNLSSLSLKFCEKLTARSLEILKPQFSKMEKLALAHFADSALLSEFSFPLLRQLTLRNCMENPALNILLTKLPNVKCLDLEFDPFERTNVCAEGFSALCEKASSFKNLKFKYRQIEDTTMHKILPLCTKIESLSLEVMDMTDQAFANPVALPYLPSFSCLRTLSLSQLPLITNVTLNALAPFLKLLEEFEAFKVNITDFDSLFQNAVELKELSLTDIPIDNSHLSHLTALKELRTLNLSETNVDEGLLNSLKPLPDLISFAFYKTKITLDKAKEELPQVISFYGKGDFHRPYSTKY